jgi:ABC-type histidine transport system ATPase subunit
MEGMSTLKVAHQLNATVNQLYEQTISRLEGAFASVCNDFRQNQYMKVSPDVIELPSQTLDASVTHMKSVASQ